MTSQQKILELATEKVKKLTTLVVSAEVHGKNAGYNKTYLTIWRGILGKEGDWEKLNAFERLELRDALNLRKMDINSRGEITKPWDGVA